MSDITSNTKRFTSASGFAGASTNDLIRIAAQAIDYAGECTRDHDTQETFDGMRARVINAIREDADCIDADDDQFTFEYDGMTFRVVTEEVMDSMKEDAITNMIDEAYYELEQLKKNSCYVSNYVTLDEDMFRRDAQHDVDSWVSHYDGVVHEMYWCEYGAGRTCCGYANDSSSDTVIRRGTLYMIRED